MNILPPRPDFEMSLHPLWTGGTVVCSSGQSKACLLGQILEWHSLQMDGIAVCESCRR